MTDQAYHLSSFDRLLEHGTSHQRLLHDHPVDEHDLEADALVASGDCFVTLATVLDQLQQSLVGAGKALQPELEKVTRTLLYLQRHYTITKKRPNYRQ